MKAYNEKLNDMGFLYNEAKAQGLSSFNERHLDNACNAVSIQEIQFVIENTTSLAVQIYALGKLDLFTEGKKSTN